MNGFETAEKIREITGGHIRILFLTAYDGEELLEEVHNIGNAGILAKPFFVSAFKEKILEMQMEHREEDEAAKKEEISSLKGLHLLAAEDNEINAEILRELLDMEGISCEIAENGKLVLERFSASEEGEFDAILMDVQMPVMNGYEATKAIRALQRSDAGSIPVIAMTANAFAEDVKEALEAGMDAHVAKPIDMEVLRATLNQYIIRKG